MFRKKWLKIAYFAFWTALLLRDSAGAYIDPATTSYIIQIFAGIFISLGVVFGAFSAKTRAGLINFRIYLLRRKIAREAARKQRRSPALAAAPEARTAPAVPAAKIRKGRFLVEDGRSFWRRLLLAGPVCFAFVFTFFIFGPYDLFLSNRMFFPYPFADVWLPVLLAGLLICLPAAGALSLLRGRLFDLAVSLLAGLLVAGYVQGNFLNLPLGQLTGDAIPWHEYTGHALLNTAVWAAIASLPLLLRYFAPKGWKTLLPLACAVLTAMQLVGLGSTLAAAPSLGERRSEKYLSSRGMYELSPKGNVIVLLLDRLDQQYVDDILAEDPAFFDGLDGFVQFTNNTSSYCRSFPSAVHMLTGRLSRYEEPAAEFFQKAWGESTFFPDLKSAGYATKLYMTSPYLYSDISQIDGIADNVVDGGVRADSLPMLRKLFLLSLFRYSPHCMKPSFYIATKEFEDTAKSGRVEEPYRSNDAAFADKLRKKGLSMTEKDKNFVYYHLNGMHDYVLDESARPLAPGESGSQNRQMRACFSIVYEFLRQMKELGIYEDATVIITGDHGKSFDSRPLDRAVATGLFVKLPGRAGVPLERSNAPVSHDALRATVIRAAGLDSAPYGETYFDAQEGSGAVRRYYYRVDDREKKRHFVEEFEIVGDAKDFSNWRKVGEFDIKYLHG